MSVPATDLLKVDHIFVTHTHMDHFIGFDQILRLLLGRPKRLHLYGPKGFLNHVTGKLSGYVWNLVHNYDEALVLEATEIEADYMVTQSFDCRSGFKPSAPCKTNFVDQIAHQEPALIVRAAILDHQIPCLAFNIQENFHVNFLKSKMDEFGLAVGPWLGAVKKLLHDGADQATEVFVPLAFPKQGPRIFTLRELTAKIVRITRGQKIAYVSDSAYHSTNEDKILSLALGADHLFIEAAFLDKDRDIAKAKFHLTARQAGHIARASKARQVTIFHYSPRYAGKGHLLEAEARQAFEGLL